MTMVSKRIGQLCVYVFKNAYSHKPASHTKCSRSRISNGTGRCTIRQLAFSDDEFGERNAARIMEGLSTAVRNMISLRWNKLLGGSGAARDGLTELVCRYEAYVILAPCFLLA